MKAYTKARFSYFQIKWKNSFAKVKDKNCQKFIFSTRTTFVFVNLQCIKGSKVGIIKGRLER